MAEANPKLSDFTLAGWIFILLTLAALIGGAIVMRWLLAWLLPQGGRTTYAVLALPGLCFMGGLWLLYRRLGIRLVKSSADRRP